nr:uncharacterized protein LOC111505323 isoform X1 [Leptinotarsa decemlineata]
MSGKRISGLFGGEPQFSKRNHFLSLGFYARNPCTIPIVMLAIADMCWVTFCTVQGFIRTDIILTRKSRQQGEMTELLLNPVNRKFLTFTQTFPPQPELYNAYEEMRCEEEKRKKECESNK